MGDIVSSSSSLFFKVNQIVCLEHGHNCLFGEVIQLVPERGLCWFRPMCIVKSDCNSNGYSVSDSTQLINLQLGSDLLWPTTLFRHALDTEVVSFLTELNSNESLVPKTHSRHHLNQFIQEVWQANKEKF